MPRKRQSTKSRIVKSAWTLFYKKGYDKTTIEDIIVASKTSKGSFYHYFKGKEALLNSISYLFDEKYEELYSTIDTNLSAYDTLLLLNYELFHMIETSIDVKLVGYLYSSQLVTKDKRSLLEGKRFYFKWLTEIFDTALQTGEFHNSSTTDELMKIYAMFERALLYDWALCEKRYSLSEYSARLLPSVLDSFVRGL
jgi:Transcriptional regulator